MFCLNTKFSCCCPSDPCYFHLCIRRIWFGRSGFTSGIIKGIAKIYITFNSSTKPDRFLDASQDIYNTILLRLNDPSKLFTAGQNSHLFCGSHHSCFYPGCQDPSKLFTGLGAMAAVLMFVFKDPILGFVASIQLAANKMVKPGDWITVPKFNVDGTVVDISLTTVKVQNWDKTITSIPTYSLVSESVTNWIGITESGGRRIQRSVFIDMARIKFATEICGSNHKSSRHQKLHGTEKGFGSYLP